MNQAQLDPVITRTIGIVRPIVFESVQPGHDGRIDDFEKLASHVTKMKVGEGTEVGVNMGPLINERALEKVETHVKDAVGHGAQVVTGGRRHELGGTFYEPTVLTEASTKMLITREEVFGPVAALFRFKAVWFS